LGYEREEECKEGAFSILLKYSNFPKMAGKRHQLKRGKECEKQQGENSFI
jgi:hypothetical protein